MTKAEIDRLDPEAAQHYFENDYPFVFPENEVLDVVGKELTGGLSKLENAYVQWMLETNNAKKAVESFIHPAYYYDTARFGAAYLRQKEHLAEAVRKLRRECPYLKLYTIDYLAGIIHNEIQYLRARERKDRFYGPHMDPTKFLGKKSPHDQEMEEIDRLLACLQQLQDLKISAAGILPSGNSNVNPSDGQPGNSDSGVDRVIAKAKELISQRKIATGGGTGGGPSDPPTGPVVSTNGSAINGVHM